MSTPTLRAERLAQKKRTRQLLLDTAATIIAAGSQPSVTQAADAAGVSRRTAYRYFPSQEKLLAEAALDALRPKMEATIEAAASGDSLAELEVRLIAMVRALQSLTARNETLLRTMVHSTIIDKGSDTPKRGSRRIDWIEQTLRPLKRRLKSAAYERLVSGIALSVGIEALLVLRDIRGLTSQQIADTSEWIATSLLRSALRESRRE